MTLYATAINPMVLKWAREQSGYSIEDIAQHFKKPSEIVVAWEGGQEVPTYKQLEDLSDLFKRPVAVFFFPEPPHEKRLESEFRTLPESEISHLLPDIRFAIREAS